VDFSDALKQLRNGQALYRTGWNSQDQFIYLVPQNSYPAQTGIAQEFFGDDAQVPYGPYIAIKTVQGLVVPWLPSQTDVLNDDWAVKEDLK
jgi:hypothetical protein